jgi:hypothetical protein
LQTLFNILEIFGKCTGLKINMSKTQIFPIRCRAKQIESLLTFFPSKVASFPGKYLGLPLHTRKLRKVEFHPLIDKIGGRLPRWKGKSFSRSSHEALVKTVLSAQLIYQLMCFPAQKWLIKRIDRLMLFYGKGMVQKK